MLQNLNIRFANTKNGLYILYIYVIFGTRYNICSSWNLAYVDMISLINEIYHGPFSISVKPGWSCEDNTKTDAMADKAIQTAMSQSECLQQCWWWPLCAYFNHDAYTCSLFRRGSFNQLSHTGTSTCRIGQ